MSLLKELIEPYHHFFFQGINVMLRGVQPKEEKQSKKSNIHILSFTEVIKLITHAGHLTVACHIV
jgi:hypothetical protein